MREPQIAGWTASSPERYVSLPLLVEGDRNTNDVAIRGDICQPAGSHSPGGLSTPGRHSREHAEPRGVSEQSWVYMLRCRDGSLYAGWTIDLERRLISHQAGRASRYTASRLPVALVYARTTPDRSAARREEARIKRLSRAQKLRLIATPCRPERA